MLRNTLILLTISLLIILMILSCSSGSDNVVTDLVTDQDIQVKSQRELLGIWRLDIDLESQSTKVEFDRDLAAHFDVTELIPPPAVSNESYDGNTNIYQADFTIQNTLGMDAFDIRMIVYTDDAGHELKNLDNWTPLYDMPDGAFINPFKAYATSEPARIFANSVSHTETLNIYLPGGISYQNIILAIDASMPSNCGEPYLIDNDTQEDLKSGAGSSANITVDVYDWQADVDSVKLHCIAITGNPSDNFSFDSGNTWSLNLVNNNGVSGGDYLAMISATSTGSGNLELYDILTIAVSSSTYEWAKTWGGADFDRSYSVSLDQAGNAYVTGLFQGTAEFNPDGGGTQSSNGDFDVFLSKFDSSGNWQWTKTWGGTEWDTGCSVSLDQAGNAYVTGEFHGTVDFDPDGGGTQTANGVDAFLSKFDSAGSWLWTKTWGGIATEIGTSVSLDQADNVYVTGHFHLTVEFNPDGGGAQSANGDNHDAFLSKFDSSGNWLWTKTWGGIYEEGGHEVSLDQSGNAYVIGSFWNTADFNPDGGGTQASNGAEDVYLSKFDSSGNWQWTKTWGGTSWDYGLSVTLDQAGNAYITGDFQGAVDFNPDGGGTQSSNGSYDVYLSKFDSSGNWLWTKTWGGISWDRGLSVSLDQAGNAYVTGYFSLTVDFNPDGGGTQSTYGDQDVYLSKFNSSGIWQWTKTWGGINTERSFSVSLDQSGYAYVTGHFMGTADFNPDGGDPQSSNGFWDAFLWKGNY